MALKTGGEYLESLESLDLEAHALGEKTDNLAEHGLIGPSRQAVAFTYDAAHDPRAESCFALFRTCAMTRSTALHTCTRA